MIKNNTFIFFLFLLGCFYGPKNAINIEKNIYSGEKIYITELDERYKKEKNFNKIWMDYYSGKYRPYHRLQNKFYTILGIEKKYKSIFLVVKDIKGKIFKKNIEFDKKINFPSYIVFENDINKAKTIIGNIIWLNDVFDFENFYSLSEYDFSKVEQVKVTKIIFKQNSEKGSQFG